MARQREHHYVSQFYLRNFSADGRSINMINIDRNRFIPKASIRGQCSRRNFYGSNNTVENAFGTLEAYTAPIISSILRDQALPAARTPEMAILLTFIVLQRSRTQAAANSNDSMTDKLAKLQVEGMPEFSNVDINNFEIRNHYPSALPIKVAAQAVDQALDLGMHLLMNKTATDLITSDEPLVAHNQYCEGISYMGVCGWQSSGIQLLWPLSPQVLLFVYDRQIYKVGEKNERLASYISDPLEIHQLNAFQILNSVHNIYFKSEDQHNQLKRQLTHIAKKKLKERMCFVRAKCSSDENDKSELLHMYEPLHPHKLNLSAVRIRRSMRRLSLEIRGHMHRNRAIPDLRKRLRSEKGMVKYVAKQGP